MISIPRLYAIADAAFGNPIVMARELFNGGARLVQVRNKNASAREHFNQVVTILEFAPADSCVIVNDRADVALLSGAGGVHLGQKDRSPGSRVFNAQSQAGFGRRTVACGLYCRRPRVSNVDKNRRGSRHWPE